MYLIFDTETTTFPDSKLSARHPTQARVCQLAAIKLDKDFNEVEVLSTLIKPDGWRISSGAQAVHGITMERCEAEGRAMIEVLQELQDKYADCRYTIAHNLKFDRQMMQIEMECLEYYPIFRREPKRVCTMELTTPICKLPQKRKGAFGQQYKWPKLQEAYQYFFKESFDKAHDALADVRATARIFKYLAESGRFSVVDKQQAVQQEIV